MYWYSVICLLYFAVIMLHIFAARLGMLVCQVGRVLPGVFCDISD